jgi:hypothetical protein
MALFGKMNSRGSAVASDFEKNSLGRISTIWARVKFVASLREGTTYLHWGLSRTYDERAVADALSDAHRLCFLELLRASAEVLQGEAEFAAKEDQTDVAEYTRRMWEARDIMVPLDPGGGSPAHLEWILFVQWKIAEQSRAAFDPGASPLLPLGQ